MALVFAAPSAHAQQATPPAAKSDKPVASKGAKPRIGIVEAARRYADGLDLEQRGDERGALAAFLEAGDGGNGLAQRKLGDIYGTGNTAVARDYESSLRWYERARRQGIEISKPTTNIGARPSATSAPSSPGTAPTAPTTATAKPPAVPENVAVLAPPKPAAKPELTAPRPDQKAQPALPVAKPTAKPDLPQTKPPLALARPPDSITPSVAVARPAVNKVVAKPIALGPLEASRRYTEGVELDRRGDQKGALLAFTEAAESGNGPAQQKLGDIYGTGNQVVARDYETSLRWYDLARQQGMKIPKPFTFPGAR